MDIFSSIPDINGNLPDDIFLPEQTESIRRVNINGKRHYEVKTKDGVVLGTFPSITTILSETQDNTFLENWRERIGDDAADKISVEATERGTVMHRLCELYCELPDSMDRYKRLQLMLENARNDDEVNQHDTRSVIVGSQLFFNFYHSGFFDNIKRGIFQEKFLWNHLIYKGEDLSYAGTVDNFSIVMCGDKKVIDFKTAKKRKPDKWILNYKKQCAAYSYAIMARYNIMPDGCEIWISNEVDNDPQIFKMNSDDIKYYFKEFLKDRRKINNK